MSMGRESTAKSASRVRNGTGTRYAALTLARVRPEQTSNRPAEKSDYELNRENPEALGKILGAQCTALDPMAGVLLLIIQ